MFASSQSKNARVADRAVLDHLGEARGELAVGQRAQAVGVDQHGARLVERADHVLAERMVDAGLAADRRVDLREQRRRHLHERHAALVDRGGEAGEVADDAAAQRDQRRRALGPQLEEARQDVVQRRPGLVRLAVRDEDRLAGDARRGEARAQRREPVRGDDRIGDDDRARRGSSGASSAPASREQARRRCGSDSCARRARRRASCMAVTPAARSAAPASSARAKRAISLAVGLDDDGRRPRGRARRAARRARRAGRADRPR